MNNERILSWTVSLLEQKVEQTDSRHEQFFLIEQKKTTNGFLSWMVSLHEQKKLNKQIIGIDNFFSFNKKFKINHERIIVMNGFRLWTKNEWTDSRHEQVFLIEHKINK
jgi:hypothetical protein